MPNPLKAIQEWGRDLLSTRSSLSEKDLGTLAVLPSVVSLLQWHLEKGRLSSVTEHLYSINHDKPRSISGIITDQTGNRCLKLVAKSEFQAAWESVPDHNPDFDYKGFRDAHKQHGRSGHPNCAFMGRECIKEEQEKQWVKEYKSELEDLISRLTELTVPSDPNQVDTEGQTVNSAEKTQESTTRVGLSFTNPPTGRTDVGKSKPSYENDDKESLGPEQEIPSLL